MSGQDVKCSFTVMGLKDVAILLMNLRLELAGCVCLCVCVYVVMCVPTVSFLGAKWQYSHADFTLVSFKVSCLLHTYAVEGCVGSFYLTVFILVICYICWLMMLLIRYGTDSEFAFLCHSFFFYPWDLFTIYGTKLIWLDIQWSSKVHYKNQWYFDKSKCNRKCKIKSTTQ